MRLLRALLEGRVDSGVRLHIGFHVQLAAGATQLREVSAKASRFATMTSHRDSFLEWGRDAIRSAPARFTLAESARLPGALVSGQGELLFSVFLAALPAICSLELVHVASSFHQK